MTVREIQGHLEEIYGVQVSSGLIAQVTEAVMDEVKAWQSRPLDALYPIVYLDCIHVKVRDGGTVGVKTECRSFKKQFTQNYEHPRRLILNIYI